MKFTVYYELNGRKMKTTVTASDRLSAENQIRQRLKIHAIDPVLENPFEDLFQLLKYAHKTNI